MHWLPKLADRSLRTTYIVFNFTSICLALLSTGVALFIYESHQQRVAASRELLGQARIVADANVAALAFDDASSAARNLDALHADSQIISAAIYDSNDRLFTCWRETRAHAPGPAAVRPAGVYFDADSISVFQPVWLEGHRAGTIVLKSKSEITARLRQYTGIVVLILGASLGLYLIVSGRMQRRVVEPITELSGTARAVALSRNYSLRVSPGDPKAPVPGEISGLIGSFNEMLSRLETHESVQRRAEALLRESEERYALAARGANDGLWDWKLPTEEVYFSPRWYEMLGYPAERRPSPSLWFDLIHPLDRQRVTEELAAHQRGESPEFASEYRIRHRNGTYIWVLARGLAVRDANGKAVRMAGSQTDITKGKIADPLTGMPNRLYFLDRVEAVIQAAKLQAANGDRSGCAVLFLDLDRFKLINDSLGHAAGDELLMGVSGRLRAAVGTPEPPLAGCERVIARFGGDEFAVMLADREAEELAGVVAERILQRLTRAFRLADRQVFASFSIGIALWSGQDTAEDLLRNADTAMYYAKTHGRSRVETFDQQMRERAIARLETESELRKAIDANELCLFYQPQVHLKTGRIVGYEALVRWNNPVRGLLTPGEFVPIAEESDLIIALGRWVLREACRQTAEWHRCFPTVPPVRVSVNVSPRQLVVASFLEDVRSALRQSGLEPAHLTLEVTESSIMTNREVVIAMLNDLKQMGVGLEIDDFGTGYSSLSYLQHLPFNTLKIDRSFIQNLNAAADSAQIVEAILALARSLGMTVVAEGVENAEQIEMLDGLDCGYVQGFYFARPLSATTVESQIRAASKSRRSDFEHLLPQHSRPSEPIPVEKPAEELSPVA